MVSRQQVYSSSAALQAAPRVEFGYANAHHGEIFQGVLADSGGRLRRGLVSLVCDVMTSEAIFQPDDTGIVSVDPVWKTKARRAVELTLEYLGQREVGGRLVIESTIPPRWGMGSSTSDVTAAIRAACGEIKLSPHIVAALAVQAETASDSLMFGNRAVLFAHREGVIIEDFGGALPPLEVVGFNTDPTGSGVDTLSYTPARYGWREIEAFRPLVGLMRQAVQMQSPHLAGRVATASSRINQRYLPKPHFDKIERLAEDTGALGVQVAHSGTIAGLLFDPGDPSTPERAETAKTMLDELRFTTWQFQSREL
ncbi:MAG: hypothetical protein DMF61_21570 [Blastocatellia bacterium AA13]|nr:MAG: hypothetical protein DMF61_21570 [Blastocatellia bacterium AA13]